MKNVALMQLSASVFRTFGVETHGPSSKVSTTSPFFRKSWFLKCSKPNPGPPVVSISTVRDMPIASGLSHFAATGAGAAAGGGAGVFVAGACAQRAVDNTTETGVNNTNATERRITLTPVYLPQYKHKNGRWGSRRRSRAFF